jgi:peptidylprolyl isomerase
MKKTLALFIVLGLISCGKKEEPAQIQPTPEPAPAAAPAPAPLPTEPIKSGDTTINPSGLKFIDVKEGKGASPKAGQVVSVMYTGKLVDGFVFDSNQDPKFGHPEPLKFPVGAGRVIPGWDEGFLSMKVGGKRKLIIPPNLAYGSQPPPGSNIPLDAWLIFDVELIGVQ